jgi:hypothetical protein
LCAGLASSPPAPFRYLKIEIADGLAAVDAFGRAAGCFRVAGDDGEAVRCAEAATSLRREIEEGYAAHRVKLEHALDVDDADTARREVKLPRRLLTGKTGPYVEWLGMVERRLTPAPSEEPF